MGDVKGTCLKACLVAGAFALPFAAGCIDDGDKRRVGAVCKSSAECESGLCGGGQCLDPEADDDGDGLVNRYEVLVLGTDPLSDDTDGDGIKDGDELVDGQLVDTDGDGKPDALESAFADADQDCIPDQYDAEDDVNNSDLTPIFGIVCQVDGVCGVDPAKLRAVCPEDTKAAYCDYSQVADYEETEVSCDQLDNDCDGLVDEDLPATACVSGLAIAPEAPRLWVSLTSKLSAFTRADGADVEDVSAGAAWESDDAGVVTVSADGTITGIGKGTANVTATYEGFSDVVTVTVVGDCPPGQELTGDGCAGVSGGLVGHYKLDGDALDSSGGFYDGVLVGAEPVADRFGTEGGALFFCDPGDRVEIVESGHPLGEVTATYALWVKPATDAGNFGVLNAGTVLEADRRSGIVLNDGRHCAEYVGESNDSGPSEACLRAGFWSHLAVTKAGTELKFYFNGAHVGDLQTQPGQDLDSSRLVLGLSTVFEDGGVYEQHCGALDDVRVYDRVLSAEEIGRLAALGGWQPVGTPANPGRACDHVLLSGGADGDGRYWVDPDGDGPGPAFEAYCDMTTDGGGWTLVYAYGFTDFDGFVDDSNAVTPRPAWPLEAGDTPVSTTPPTGPDDRGAIDWALWRNLGDEMLLTSNINDHVVCTPIDGSLAVGVDGAVDCRVVAEIAPACDGVAPSRLWWGPYGPSLAADDLYYYWDASTDANWPTHDPCGQNQDNHLREVDTPSGAIWLRDTPWEWSPPSVASCDDLRHVLQYPLDGSYALYPWFDGVAFEAECLYSAAGGGFTRMDATWHEVVQGHDDRHHSYLFYRDGAWYRSPATTAIWDWEGFTAVEGTWYYGGSEGLGSFDCASAETDDAVGLGCSNGPGDTFKAIAISGFDPAEGTVTLCQDRPDVFGVGSCAGGVAVYERQEWCPPDAGNLLHDGSLDADLTEQYCWWYGGPQGYADGFSTDAADVPGGASGGSLRVDIAAPSESWEVVATQAALPLLPGHAYAIGFWARADASRELLVHAFRQNSPYEGYAFEAVAVGPEWARHQLAFVVEGEGSMVGAVELQLGGAVGSVWLDQVVVSDLGPDPCVAGGGNRVRDPGFDYGGLCWEEWLIFGEPGEQPSVSYDPGEAAPTGSAPAAAMNKAWDTVVQVGHTIDAGQPYDLVFWARAAEPQNLRVFVQADDLGQVFSEDVAVTTEWQQYARPVFSSQGSTQARIEFQHLPETDATVWIDDVRFVESALR